MKIFHLKVLNFLDLDYHYDAYDEKVIIASNEENARNIANKETGEEGKIWNDPNLVSCEQIDLRKNEEYVLLSSFNAS